MHVTWESNTGPDSIHKFCKTFTYAAKGAIFKAMDLETQKPAPPVANQK